MIFLNREIRALSPETPGSAASFGTSNRSRLRAWWICRNTVRWLASVSQSQLPATSAISRKRCSLSRKAAWVRRKLGYIAQHGRPTGRRARRTA